MTVQSHYLRMKRPTCKLTLSVLVNYGQLFDLSAYWSQFHWAKVKGKLADLKLNFPPCFKVERKLGCDSCQACLDGLNDAVIFILGT